MKKLNLGCGEDYKEGWINLDCRSNVKLDVKQNLEEFPYPFKDNTFDEIYTSHVLEHLLDPIRVLKEIIRISKDGARIIVKVPHAYSYANVASIQHKANFTEHSFTEHHLREYDLKNIYLVKFKFTYANKWKKLIPFKKYFKIFLNGIYDDLYFEFKIKKD